MELQEITKVDQIEVTDLNTIQIRKATIIIRDGVEISRSFHRHVISPGEDYSNEDSKVQLIASTLWTQEVIDNYQNFMLSKKLEREQQVQIGQINP